MVAQNLAQHCVTPLAKLRVYKYEAAPVNGNYSFISLYRGENLYLPIVLEYRQSVINEQKVVAEAKARADTVTETETETETETRTVVDPDPDLEIEAEPSPDPDFDLDFEFDLDL